MLESFIEVGCSISILLELSTIKKYDSRSCTGNYHVQHFTQLSEIIALQELAACFRENSVVRAQTSLIFLRTAFRCRLTPFAYVCVWAARWGGSHLLGSGFTLGLQQMIESQGAHVCGAPAYREARNMASAEPAIQIQTRCRSGCWWLQLIPSSTAASWPTVPLLRWIRSEALCFWLRSAHLARKEAGTAEIYSCSSSYSCEAFGEAVSGAFPLCGCRRESSWQSSSCIPPTIPW